MIVIILKIIGLTLASIIIIILAIIFTVRIKVSIKFRDDLILKLTCLGLSLYQIPKAPRKRHFRNYTLESIAKRGVDTKYEDFRDKLVRRTTEVSLKATKKLSKILFGDEDPTPNKKYSSKGLPSPSFSDKIDLLFKVIKLFFGRFFGSLHLKVAKIKIKVGSSDAAQTALLHTAICSAMQPALTFIDRHTNLDGIKKSDIDISPDYLREDIEFDVDLMFSIKLAALIGVIIRALVAAIVDWDELQTNTAQSSSQTAKKNTNT